MAFSEGVQSIKFSKATGFFGRDHGDIVNLSLGEPNDSPPDSAMDAYVRALRTKGGNSRYAPVQGIEELRRELALKLKRESGIDSSIEEVMVTGGASEALSYSIMSTVDRNDEVIIAEPSYPIMSPMVRFCGGRAIPFRLDKEDHFSPDIMKLQELTNSRTKMIIINTPHNPTGNVFSKGELKAISEIFDGYIMIDEVYENFTYGDSTHHSLASFAKDRERIITVNSFSKTYCMCGYRVGYLHAEKELIRQMTKLKLCIATCTNRPAQMAALEALRDVRFPGEIRKRFDKRRELLLGGLSKLGIPVVEPKGAFYAFPDITEFGSDEEAFRLFLKAGVLTMPGTVFHESCSEHLRLSFAANCADISEGIERLEGVIS